VALEMKIAISRIQPCARDRFQLTENRPAWQKKTESALRNVGTKYSMRREDNLAHLIPSLLVSWN
jgi:hypothetical protein